MAVIDPRILAWIRRKKESLLGKWNSLDKNFRNRLLIAFLLAESLSLTLLLRKIFISRMRSGGEQRVVPVLASVGLSSLLSLIREGKVVSVNFYPDGKLIGADETRGELFQAYRVPGSESNVFEAVQSHCKEYRMIESKPNVLAMAAQIVVPVAFLGVWYQLLKSFMKSTTEDTTNFDRSRAIPKISFNHVISSSKIELQEIVDYLNNPTAYAAFGAKLPRGVLLVGPSGTGKTLMARAVAGEAKCAFLSVSASEFVETYVGRGAARIRQLFKQARSMAPCVLFIDEIDALGQRQGNFSGGTAHDEYVQTMNQLLVELDGISGQEDGLVVIGATNRVNALESALLRPGRFDRHVWLQLPTDRERMEILRVNCGIRSIKLGEDADLVAIARECIAFSGADLANLINEAIFFSLRRRAESVSMADLRCSLEKCKQIVRNRNKTTSSPSFLRGHNDINTALE